MSLIKLNCKALHVSCLLRLKIRCAPLLHTCLNRRDWCACLVRLKYSLLTVFFLNWQGVMHTSSCHIFYPHFILQHTDGSVFLAVQEYGLCYTVHRHKFHQYSTGKGDLAGKINVHTEVLPQQPCQNRVSVRDEVSLLLLLALQ